MHLYYELCRPHGPVIRPGSSDRSLLQLQNSHRSEEIRQGRSDRVLSFREHVIGLTRDRVIDDSVLEYIRRIRFYCIHRFFGGGFELDRVLLMMLIERWRHEMHTSHLAVGEATITLQDVVVPLGLRVNGPPVTGPPHHNWHGIVEELLGIRSGVDEATQKPYLKGSFLRLMWLRRYFSRLPPDAEDVTLQRFSRAYILALMGSILFPDKSGDNVSLFYLLLLRDWERALSYSL